MDRRLRSALDRADSGRIIRELDLESFFKAKSQVVGIVFQAESNGHTPEARFDG